MVMGVLPGPDLLRPLRGEDVHVGSGIQFPSLPGCNHLFGVQDPYGTQKYLVESLFVGSCWVTGRISNLIGT